MHANDLHQLIQKSTKMLVVYKNKLEILRDLLKGNQIDEGKIF